MCSVNFSRPHNVPSSANGACYRTTSGWPAWADQTANCIEGRKREDNDWQEERGKRGETEELIQELRLWTGRRRFILPGIHICSSLQVRLDQSDLKASTPPASDHPGLVWPDQLVPVTPVLTDDGASSQPVSACHQAMNRCASEKIQWSKSFLQLTGFSTDTQRRRLCWDTKTRIKNVTFM